MVYRDAERNSLNEGEVSMTYLYRGTKGAWTDFKMSKNDMKWKQKQHKDKERDECAKDAQKWDVEFKGWTYVWLTLI